MFNLLFDFLYFNPQQINGVQLFGFYNIKINNKILHINFYTQSSMISSIRFSYDLIFIYNR